MDNINGVQTEQQRETKAEQQKDLKDVISANLIALRQQAGLTQLQLAEMLNYSDKAVSKWERGESIPDLRVLIKIAEIYHITLDDIVKEKKGTVKPKLNLKKKHNLITLLSVGLVWVIATAVFMIFYYIVPLAKYSYLAFICAPFVSSVVYTVFASIWYRRITLAVAASLVLWSIILIIHVCLYLFTHIAVWPFYVVAGGIQVLVIGWFVLRKLYKPNRKPKDTE
ncbi:MAG: helix-turn-helix domain-containing protein [Candidatus Coproplasma sp.]